VKTISIPANTEHLFLDEVAHLISDCRNPEGANDPEGVRYELDKIQAEHEAHQAVRDGLLRVRHPGTHGPFPMALGLERAVVLVPDAVAYLAEYGMQVVQEESLPTPQSSLSLREALQAQDSGLTEWKLMRPSRFQGYGKPLHDFLRAAHAERRSSPPKARDVLDHWKSNPPPEVLEVTNEGLKYYDSNGDVKAADIDAIRQAINRMLG
jgi:hypothetical protein